MPQLIQSPGTAACCTNCNGVARLRPLDIAAYCTSCITNSVVTPSPLVLQPTLPYVTARWDSDSWYCTSCKRGCPTYFPVSDGIDSVIGKRGLFMCRIASLFLLQRLKGSMSGNAHNFNNIKSWTIKFYFFCKARFRRKFTPFGEKHASLYATVKNLVAQFNMIFPPVIRLALDDPK
jgi:hypothetical protein